MIDDGIAQLPSSPGRRLDTVALFVLCLILFTALPLTGDTTLLYHDEDRGAPPSSALMSYEFMGFEIPEDAFPLSVTLVDELPDALSESDAVEAIERAIASWNSVPCSYAELRWAGVRTSMDDVADGELAIIFSDDFDEIPQTIATFTWPHPTPPLGMDIYLNSLSYDWTLEAQPRPDFPHLDRPTVVLSAALAHELGHALGLDHTTAHNAATMAPHYLIDGSQSELSADDKLGLCELYPQPGSECSRDLHCPVANSCVSGDHGNVCDIHLADIGDYCGYSLQHCPDFCHIEEAHLGIGFCSTDCTNDDDCPEYYLCIDDDDDGPHCRIDPDSPPAQDGCSSTHSTPTPQGLISLLTLLAVFGLRWPSTTGSHRASR